MAGLGDLLGLARNFGDLQQKLQAVQEELARQTVEGSAGGGMVTATVNGRLELVDLKIDAAAGGRDDVGLLQDMVRAAVGQALDKARDMQREGMAKLLGGMPMPPGLLDMLG